jgi:uroporphyrinogen-III synthase
MSALSGRHILVTRPVQQAQGFAAAVTQLGGIPVLFPLLEIRPVDHPANLQALALQLDQFDLAFFVSPNAVEHALTVLLSQQRWPEHLAVATVGPSSERALAAYGFKQIIAPQHRYDSEAVLELEAMQAVAGQKIIIFRGDGGRDLLGDTLTARGAIVQYCCCYHRSAPTVVPEAVIQLLHSRNLDGLTLTSSESVAHLGRLVASQLSPTLRDFLYQLPVFAPHARIITHATAAGFQRCIATAPGDQGLLEALISHFAPSGKMACQHLFQSELA